MYPSSSHLPTHAHEEFYAADRDTCRSKAEVIKGCDQETIHTYYHHHLSMDGHNAMWGDLVSCGAVSAASIHRKINYERLLQEGFNLPSPTLRAVKRKAETIDVPGGGRKDKHSKVCTARGPRDRRVRLSPKTAIQFYDVQDRLGYDRPSKAIDWLIKEAKAAIDALYAQPLLISSNHLSAATHSHSNGNSQHMIQKQEDLNDENPVSSFSFFLDGFASPASYTELQVFPDQEFNLARNRSKVPEAEDATLHPGYRQGLLSALTTTNSQILDTDWEVAKLQKVLTSNCVIENSGNARGEKTAEDYSSSPNSPSLHFPNLENSQAFPQTEHLHSSIINLSPVSINFPGFDFSNELSNVTAQKGGEKEKSVLSKTSSATPFLHYQG